MLVVVFARGAMNGRDVSVIVVVRLLTSMLDLARVLEGRREMLEGFLCRELAPLGRRGTVGGSAQSIQSASSTGVSLGAEVQTKALFCAEEKANVLLVGAAVVGSSGAMLLRWVRAGRAGDAMADVVFEKVRLSKGNGNLVCVAMPEPWLLRPIAAAIVA